MKSEAEHKALGNFLLYQQRSLSPGSNFGASAGGAKPTDKAAPALAPNYQDLK